MMDFWSIIGNNMIVDEESVEHALDGVRRRLHAVSSSSLIRFADRVAEYCYRLDQREFAEVLVPLCGELVPQTEDKFLYTRCTVILSGWQTYSDVLDRKISFDLFVKPGLGAEPLMYLASEVYEERTNKKFTYRSEFPLEAGSNPAGWQ